MSQASHCVLQLKQGSQTSGGEGPRAFFQSVVDWHVVLLCSLHHVIHLASLTASELV